MKPAPFHYRRPSSIDEVVELLAEHGRQAAILAGGQSLVPLLNQRQRRPAVVIDLAAVPDFGRVVIGNGEVELGATVGQAPPAAVTEALPLLAQALPHVGHIQTRNRGTIAGSVAHGDPLAEIPLALLVGGGEVELASVRGRRRVPIDDFLEWAYAPARADDELVVATHWLRPPPGTGCAFVELTAGTTVVAAAATVTVDGGRITAARIGVAGPVDRPVMASTSSDAEGGGAGQPGSLRIELAAAPDDLGDQRSVAAFGRRLATALVEGLSFVDDAASDPGHRRAVAVEMATRALVAAVADSGGAGRPAGGRGRPAPGVVFSTAAGDSATAIAAEASAAAHDEVPVSLTVDGRGRTLAVEARTSLADALRGLGVTGVKLGCEQGVCGSCTVLLEGSSQRSCLVLAVQADGVEVTTAAGLAGVVDELRTAFVDHFAVQCGFCASGVLVTAAAELSARQRAGTLADLDRRDIAALLSGNVCRCSGYASMVDAIGQAAQRLAAPSDDSPDGR